MNTECRQSWRRILFVFAALVLFAGSTVAQLAPSGSIYVQQPTGVHYLFGTAGAQTGAGFYYVNYNTSDYDIISPIQVSPNGAFSGTSQITGRTISGQVSSTNITLTYRGISVSAAKQSTYGAMQKFGGGYIGVASNPALGLFSTTIANTVQGVAFVTSGNNSGFSIGVGRIDTLGNVSVTMLNGERLTTHFNPVNGLASGTVRGSFGYNYDYSIARAGPSRLANISTRGFVGVGDQVLIGGFIIRDGGKTVLINVKGPSLTSQGVGNALQNPKLQLFFGSQLIASNGNWRTNANASEIAASGAGPTDDREAALQVALEPGAYTFIASSEDTSQGIGLVEAFGID